MDDTGRAPGHLGLPLLARIKVLCKEQDAIIREEKSAPK